MSKEGKVYAFNFNDKACSLFLEWLITELEDDITCAEKDCYPGDILAALTEETMQTGDKKFYIKVYSNIIDRTLEWRRENA